MRVETCEARVAFFLNDRGKRKEIARASFATDTDSHVFDDLGISHTHVSEMGSYGAGGYFVIVCFDDAPPAPELVEQVRAEIERRVSAVDLRKIPRWRR